MFLESCLNDRNLIEKNKQGDIVFGLKITSCACLVGPRLKFIFYWNVKVLISARSLFQFFASEFAILITEKVKYHQ